MDGQWSKVDRWDIVNEEVEYYDSKGNYLGSQSVDDIIANHIETEHMNDEMEKRK